MSKKKRNFVRIVTIACLLFLIGGMTIYLLRHFHWNLSCQGEQFTESARELNNPNRGFYEMFGLRIAEEPVDWKAAIEDRIKKDSDTVLCLVEINLQAYRLGPISEAGLENLEALFEELSKQDKQYIIRFLYDWNGENMQYEPKDINIIVEHMKQIGPIVKKYKDCIFTLQSLFIGNCGEMNNTRYMDGDSLQILAKALASATDDDIFLAVRTPLHWRQIAQASDVAEVLESNSPFANRLGLFNDGMLGNVYDCGTYSTQSKSEVGIFKEWSRDEELEFQDTLCRTVPNGGEVIIDNEYNDLDNAIADFNRMHVSYLNDGYDLNVLQKWRNSTVHDEGIFDGMDGFSYMKNRLGYRLVLRECRMQQDFWKDTLQIELDIQNVGFAPIYKECEASLIFCPKEEGIMYQMKVEQNLTKLAGGNDTDQTETIQATIPLHNLSKTDYDVYFLLRDKASGKVIYFGNEQDCENNGYKIGQLTQ